MIKKDLDIEIEDVPKRKEEDEFKKSKSDNIEAEKKAAEDKKEEKTQIKGMLGSIIISAVNPILISRGYIPYSDEQQKRIIEDAEKVEEHHNIAVSPEIALGLDVAVPIVFQVIQKNIAKFGKKDAAKESTEITQQPQISVK
jgi:hypothetical protein